MIGRGTRLCTDLLGIGMDKEYFLIFDYCGNVDFFRENPNGYEGCIVTSLEQKLFNIKIDIIKTLQDFKYSDKEYMDFREQLVDEIYRKIRELPYESYQVKLKRKYVEKYKNKGSFNFLNAKDVVDLKANIFQFMMSFGEDELAKRFDFVIYTIELARINNENATKSIKHVIDTANKLAMMGTIPQVKAQKQIIDKVREGLFWKDISLSA